jgi:hypothetical protein
MDCAEQSAICVLSGKCAFIPVELVKYNTCFFFVRSSLLDQCFEFLRTFLYKSQVSGFFLISGARKEVLRSSSGTKARPHINQSGPQRGDNNKQSKQALADTQANLKINLGADKEK